MRPAVRPWTRTVRDRRTSPACRRRVAPTPVAGYRILCTSPLLGVPVEGTERPVNFHAVSERDKRHGQVVAAASLPRIAQVS